MWFTLFETSANFFSTWNSELNKTPNKLTSPFTQRLDTLAKGIGFSLHVICCQVL